VQKYNNTRDMPKKWTIYDYERWYLSEKPIVVVESVPTALYLQSLGFPSMAVFGASVTPEQFKLLRACQQGIILAPDNDKPGIKFLSKAMEYRLDRYVPTYFCDPVGEEGSGDDLADLGDKQEVKDIINGAYDLAYLY
jgi:DNA primase